MAVPRLSSFPLLVHLAIRRMLLEKIHLRCFCTPEAAEHAKAQKATWGCPVLNSFSATEARRLFCIPTALLLQHTLVGPVRFPYQLIGIITLGQMESAFVGWVHLSWFGSNPSATSPSTSDIQCLSNPADVCETGVQIQTLKSHLGERYWRSLYWTMCKS